MRTPGSKILKYVPPLLLFFLIVFVGKMVQLQMDSLSSVPTTNASVPQPTVRNTVPKVKNTIRVGSLSAVVCVDVESAYRFSWAASNVDTGDTIRDLLQSDKAFEVMPGVNLEIIAPVEDYYLIRVLNGPHVHKTGYVLKWAVK